MINSGVQVKTKISMSKFLKYICMYPLIHYYVNYYV